MEVQVRGSRRQETKEWGGNNELRNTSFQGIQGPQIPWTASDAFDWLRVQSLDNEVAEAVVSLPSFRGPYVPDPEALLPH